MKATPGLLATRRTSTRCHKFENKSGGATSSINRQLLMLSFLSSYKQAIQTYGFVFLSFYVELIAEHHIIEVEHVQNI